VIVLDTQPVSQLQRVGSKDADRIEERLQGIPVDQVRITVINGGRPVRLPYPLNNRRDVVVPPTEAN
jgi:hypothetical protein